MLSGASKLTILQETLANVLSYQAGIGGGKRGSQEMSTEERGESIRKFAKESELI